MPDRLEFGLLGPTVARYRDSELLIAKGKQRSLLAALLLSAGGVVTPDQLIDVLWDADPPPTARTALHNQVKRLRDALGEAGRARIRTWPGGYRFALEPEELDVTRFEAMARAASYARQHSAWEEVAAHAEEAMALWRGQPLADVPSELLRRREETRLEEIRIHVLEMRIGADLELGRHRNVIAELQSLVSIYPLREHLHGMLMIALYRDGRQADAMVAYRQARQRLVAELGIEPGAELRRLHQRILSAESSLQPNSVSSPDLYQGHRSYKVLGQLPVAVQKFTGRDHELQMLRQLASNSSKEPGTTLISVLSGTAGVGKTTLAIYFSYQIADQFPDGQLYLNLRGFDQSEVSVTSAEAIRSLLDELQVPPERIPALHDAQAALYRSIIAGKKMIIVLDNARDAEQIYPLLPPSQGSLVLVTSRNQLGALAATKNVHTMPIDVFSSAEATQMLVNRLSAERVQAEPAATAELIRHCVKLPLALALIAARAAARPDFPLAAFAEEFADARACLDALDVGEPTGSVRAAFSWSYGQLSNPAARMFRLLGLCQGPDISAAAAASLAGVSLGEVRETLQELTRMHMLTEPAPGRYTFHNLLRLFGAERAHEEDSDEQRTAALQRMLDHYLHCGYTAALILAPHRARISLQAAHDRVIAEELVTRTQALRWFEVERPALLSAITSAITAGLDIYAWQIAWALLDFLHWRGYWDDLIATQQTALAATARHGEHEGEALAHRSLGRAYSMFSQFGKAEHHLRKALDLHLRCGDIHGQARAHLGLGYVMVQQENYDEGLNQAQRALALHRAVGDHAGQADALNAIGWCHTQILNHHDAVECCRQALALQQELEDALGEAHTWDTLGYAYHHLKSYPKALDCYQSALAIFSKLNNSYYQATVMTHLGETHLATGDTEAARTAWVQARQILHDLEHPEESEVDARLRRITPPKSALIRQL